MMVWFTIHTSHILNTRIIGIYNFSWMGRSQLTNVIGMRSSRAIVRDYVNSGPKPQGMVSTFRRKHQSTESIRRPLIG